MQEINIGSVPNDGTGDKLRDAFIHVNDNFDELQSKDTELQSNIDKKDDLSTGYIDGLVLSINMDNSKFDISSGIYVTNIDGDIVIHNFDQIDGITPSYLTTSNVTYIGLNKNKQIIQSTSPFTNEQRRSICQIGAVIHSNRVNINVINQIKPTLKYSTNQIHDVIKAIGFLNLSGNTYSANGSNLQINKSAGTVFALGINSENPLNPHQITIPGQTNITFRYRLQNGTEYTDTTNIDPTHYDLNGVLTPLLNNNKWTVQHINLFQSGLTRIQYGQHQYNSLDEAESKLKTDTFVTESNISENAIFRSYLIIKKDCTNLSDTTKCKFIPVDKWGNVISGGVALTYDSIITSLGYTPENSTNKAINFSTVNDVKYPTVKAVKDYVDANSNTFIEKSSNLNITVTGTTVETVLYTKNLGIINNTNLLTIKDLLVTQDYNGSITNSSGNIILRLRISDSPTLPTDTNNIIATLSIPSNIHTFDSFAKMERTFTFMPFSEQQYAIICPPPHMSFNTDIINSFGYKWNTFGQLANNKYLFITVELPTDTNNCTLRSLIIQKI